MYQLQIWYDQLQGEEEDSKYMVTIKCHSEHYNIIQNTVTQIAASSD